MDICIAGIYYNKLVEFLTRTYRFAGNIDKGKN